MDPAYLIRFCGKEGAQGVTERRHLPRMEGLLVKVFEELA
jgi:hypothetical protein